MPMSVDKLVDLWIHESTCLWGRLKTLITIEAATVTAWFFASSKGWNGVTIPILITGTLVVIAIGLLMHRDGSYMQAIQKQIPEFPSPDRGARGRDLAMLLLAIALAINIVLGFVDAPKSSSGKPPTSVPERSK